MKQTSPTLKSVPVEVVGSTKFGQYPKISSEQTFNMYVSDGWLVPFPGNRKISDNGSFEGRGIFTSTEFNHMVKVSDNNVYIIDTSLSETKIGSLGTFVGDVFIAENNNQQIGICDQTDIWVFDYDANTFLKATLDFIPGYLSSHNGRLIAVATDTHTWRLSAVGNAMSWPNDSQHVGVFAEADLPIAFVPIPGLSNNALLFGSNITQLWTDVGAQLFPYQKSTSFNVDYGAANRATIASLDRFVIWLGQNKQSGPVIMYTNGGDIKQISNDGIDFRFGQLLHPNISYGFLFKQDGHLFYQLTFPHADDNLTLVFDFNSSSFYTLTDSAMNCHIAKRIAFFNNSYYFVSIKDGNTYNADSNLTNYDGQEIPMIRITKSVRQEDSMPFIAQGLFLTLEQGCAANEQRVDLSLSRDGGETFGNYVARELNALGHRKNILNWLNMGQANDLTFQFRFMGLDRFVISNAELRLG